MTLSIGRGTGLSQLRHGSLSQIGDYDHAWQVMFAYEGPHMAIRTVTLGPIPGEYSSVAVRQVLLDKHAASASVMAKEAPPSGDRCLLCRLAFGSEYEDPGLGRQLIRRNRRNRFYCNICDLFIRACPGQATLALPVLVVDVKGSRDIRNRVGLSQYSSLLAAFHRRASAIMQRHLGFILNTFGDAVIAVWPSGFLPEELREHYGWDVENPARIAAICAIRAAGELARDAPVEFAGDRLPYRGALDTTEMSIFAVCAPSKVSGLEFDERDTAETGLPFINDAGELLFGRAQESTPGSESEFQTGPAATDVAGEAVEVASALASHDEVSAGEVCVTERTDDVAAPPRVSYTYRASAVGDTRVRVVRGM